MHRHVELESNPAAPQNLPIDKSPNPPRPPACLLPALLGIGEPFTAGPGPAIDNLGPYPFSSGLVCRLFELEEGIMVRMIAWMSSEEGTCAREGPEFRCWRMVSKNSSSSSSVTFSRRLRMTRSNIAGEGEGVCVSEGFGDWETGGGAERSGVPRALRQFSSVSGIGEPLGAAQPSFHFRR